MDGPSDAAVLKPIETKTEMGISLANGINPEYGKIDPYHMAVSVIDEAIRNAVCVGADPSRIALLDNFCWGDPTNPQTLGTLVEACKGCYDAAVHFGTPFISGKDSLNNEYLGNDGKKHAIPPSLLISSIGILDNVEKSVTMDLKNEGSIIYLLGKNQKCFGGSHFNLVDSKYTQKLNNRVPVLEEHANKLYQTVYQAISNNLVTSCHDLSEGGLAVCLAEMCIAGRMGISLSLGGENPLAELFGESNTCLLLEIKPEDQSEFELLLSDLTYQRIGCVTTQQRLKISVNEQLLINLKVEDLINHWMLQV
jgi:phosphoribosylformylglycinamidine synthase